MARLQFLFGGCYFAATGARNNEQAFLKSVLAKILQQEGELEWLPSARAQDARYQSYASWMSLLGLAALFAVGAMIAYSVLQKPAGLTGP